MVKIHAKFAQLVTFVQKLTRLSNHALRELIKMELVKLLESLVLWDFTLTAMEQLLVLNALLVLTALLLISLLLCVHLVPIPLLVLPYA
jgi:hypothetical protein